MLFKEDFLKEIKDLYPLWTDLHEAITHGSLGIIGRYLDDGESGTFHYTEILEAKSLEELQNKARIKERKIKLYKSFIDGSCYENENDRREHLGCPRLYAQNSGDREALNAFPCYEVNGWIPGCPKFKTGECWKRFDKLGLKMH